MLARKPVPTELQYSLLMFVNPCFRDGQGRNSHTPCINLLQEVLLSAQRFSLSVYFSQHRIYKFLHLGGGTGAGFYSCRKYLTLFDIRYTRVLSLYIYIYTHTHKHFLKTEIFQLG